MTVVYVLVIAPCQLGIWTVCLNLAGRNHEVFFELATPIAPHEQAVLYIYHIDFCRIRCAQCIQNSTQHGAGYLALLPISENTASSLRCIVRDGASVQVVFSRIE